MECKSQLERPRHSDFAVTSDLHLGLRPMLPYLPIEWLLDGGAALRKGQSYEITSHFTFSRQKGEIKLSLNWTRTHDLDLQTPRIVQTSDCGGLLRPTLTTPTNLATARWRQSTQNRAKL